MNEDPWEIQRKKKKELLQRTQFNCPYSIHFSFHGIPLTFQSSQRDFIEEIKNYIPLKWQSSNNNNSFVINHIAPTNEYCSLFVDDPCSDIHHLDEEYTAHRDFIARKVDSSTFNTIFENGIDDGLHNFFRWFLSPRLINNQKAMLHCAAIKKKNEQVDIFLGPSGAGKTTITELSLDTNRKVLSDDMNLIGLENDTLKCYPGGVGGLYRPQTSLDRPWPIENIFWIIQGETVQFKEISPVKKNQILLASFANLPWKSFSASENSQVLILAQALLGKMNLRELTFPKDQTLWATLDP